MPSPRPASLDSQLFAAMSNVRALTTTSTACANVLGRELGVSQIRVLLVLDGRRAFTDVVRLAAIDKGQLSRTVAGLRATRLVRATESPKGAAINAPLTLSLTRTGQALRRALRRRVARADAAILRRLSQRERQALPRILEKLSTATGNNSRTEVLR